jgi:aryl-alcohol dehydrogenase-like predicted oxidoreductase/2-polyprenyl-3-methyl-5-hydroxy-6-metoxy-1,4-benzoquinol methylase
MARIGTSDLDVFPLALGGNVFGWTADRDESFAVLDAYRAGGGDFIDTADSYSAWKDGNVGGESETIIGQWLASRRPDDVVVATKVSQHPQFRGLSASNVRAAAEASLGRLGVETIDLYYAHFDDADTPLEETVAAFGQLVADGLVRYTAVSNYSADRIREWVRIARGLGVAEPVAVQPHYNLVHRETESDIVPAAQELGLSLVPYFALAKGFLTGKYRSTDADGSGTDRPSPRAKAMRTGSRSRRRPSRGSGPSPRSPPPSRRRRSPRRSPTCSTARASGCRPPRSPTLTRSRSGPPPTCDGGCRRAVVIRHPDHGCVGDDVGMADDYTHGHHESVLRVHRRRTAQNSAGYLVPELRPGMSVLDVGAGPGTISTDLAALVAPGRVHAIDASADVVGHAEADRIALGVENLSYAVDDAYALSSSDDSWDVVHAHQVLQHLTRPVDALREFRRVVAPGGVVAVRDVDYEGTIWWPRVPGLDEWREVYLAAHRGTSGDPSAGRQLKAWARAAGFADVRSSASVWLFESPEARSWWGGAWAERALHSSFADNVLRLGIADHAALERISAAWREWAESEDGWLLMPHGEILARD